MDSTKIIFKRVTRFIPIPRAKYGDFTRISQEHFIIFKAKSGNYEQFFDGGDGGLKGCLDPSRPIDLESTQNNALVKLPLLKQGDYDTWRVQNYALWEIIEEGNSFKPVARTTTNANGTSTSTIPGAVTAKERSKRSNDLNA
ncbi:hypothetical protein Tco_0415061 [Tanacetum coccineum]